MAKHRPGNEARSSLLVSKLHLCFSNDRNSAVPSTCIPCYGFPFTVSVSEKYFVAFLGDIAGILTNMV